MGSQRVDEPLDIGEVPRIHDVEVPGRDGRAVERPGEPTDDDEIHPTPAKNLEQPPEVGHRSPLMANPARRNSSAAAKRAISSRTRCSGDILRFSRSSVLSTSFLNASMYSSTVLILRSDEPRRAGRALLLGIAIPKRVTWTTC